MNEGRGTRTTVVIATILLVYNFIRALMPVDEVPSATLNGLTIAIELAMFIGVVGMVPRILRSLPEGAPRGGWIFLLVVATVSGLGIFGVRLSGGPRVELAPRNSSTSSSDEGLRHQMHEELVALEAASKKLAGSRWFQIFATQDAAQMRTLTRENLREARALCGEIRNCAERVLKVFADATAQGVAHSTLSDEPAATRPATWQATRETYVATYDYLGLIEQHWDEWLADPTATSSGSQPWQAEIRRLMDVAGTSARAAHAQIESKTPTSVAASELGKQLHDVFFSWGELNLKLADMPWLKDAAHRRSLPRSALQEVRKMYQESQTYSERAIKILAEADSKKIDVSKAVDTPAATRPELWRAWQRTVSAISEKLGVIDQNWEEYVARPFPEAESELKPWQREARRLDEVAAAASKEMESLLHPSAAPPSPPVAEVTGLAKELRELIASWHTSMEKSTATRWAKIDFENPAQKKTLTRRDFEEAVALSRVAAGLEERILKLLAQAKSQGIDVSPATTDALALRPEFWRAMQEINASRVKYRKLIDQHWDEWLTTPETIEGKLNSWQREMKRLRDAMDAVHKQITAMADSYTIATAPPVPPTKPTPAPRAQSPSANNMDALVLQTHMLPAVGDYVTALKRVQGTRWVKSPNANSYHPQKITQADLHDASDKLRELIAAIEKVRSDLDAQTLPVPAAEKEYWRIKRETTGAFQQLTKLLEDNWKEWHLSGIQPKTGEAKPWQKEALRLQGEIDKLKQIDQTSILL